MSTLNIETRKSKHFTVYVIKGNKGDSSSFDKPTHGDPERGLIPNDVYYKIRELLFGVKGEFHVHYMNSSWKILDTHVPRTYSRSGPYLMESAEDNSVAVCMTPRNKEVFWERERIFLNKDESFEVPAMETDVVIFPCHGKIEIDGTVIEKRKVLNLTQNKPYSIKAVDNSANFVYIHINGMYEPEIPEDYKPNGELLISNAESN